MILTVETRLAELVEIQMTVPQLQIFSFYWSIKRPRFCTCDKFSDDADVLVSKITLWEPQSCFLAQGLFPLSWNLPDNWFDFFPSSSPSSPPSSLPPFLLLWSLINFYLWIAIDGQMCTINTLETSFSVNLVLYFVHQSPSINLALPGATTGDPTHDKVTWKRPDKQGFRTQGAP